MKLHAFCLALLCFSFVWAQYTKVYAKPSSKQKVCNSFRKLLKSKGLRDELRSSTSGTEDNELKKMIGAQAYKDLIEAWGEGGVKYVTETDLNHDKITDYVIKKSEGTANIGSVAVVVGKKDGKSKFIESIQSEYSVTSGVLDRLEGDYLVVFEGDQDQPSLQIIENDKLKKICKLAP